MLIQHTPSELFSCQLRRCVKDFRFHFLGRLNGSAPRMAGAIRTGWILLHMKSEGGEEAAVNPLAALCLADSIVLFGFPAAEEPPARRRRRTERGEGDEKPEPWRHAHRSAATEGDAGRKWRDGGEAGCSYFERVCDGAGTSTPTDKQRQHLLKMSFWCIITIHYRRVKGRYCFPNTEQFSINHPQHQVTLRCVIIV